MIKKAKIRDIQIYAFLNKKVFLDYIEDKKKILIAMNAEKILNNDQKLKKIINTNIAYADGIGAVMALRQKELKAVKIPGAELWLDIINRYHEQKSFYLLGATQEVIEKTVSKLENEFKNLNIVGFRNGFLDSSDKNKLITELMIKKPDVVFIAQGSPRQEFLMDDLIKKHPALYMGLGGSFDVYCGLKRRAPKFFLKLNLEWFYRLLKEPTRINRQIIYAKFMYLLKTRKL